VADLEVFRRWILDHSEEYVMVKSAAEIVHAKRDHRMAVQAGYGKAGLHLLPPEDLIWLVQGLIEEGHADDVIRGVLGGNFLSLAERVWR
jgi:hypothetical protein